MWGGESAPLSSLALILLNAVGGRFVRCATVRSGPHHHPGLVASRWRREGTPSYAADTAHAAPVAATSRMCRRTHSANGTTCWSRNVRDGWHNPFEIAACL
jgi:hypothetical protein